MNVTLMSAFPFLRDLSPLTMFLRFLTACICGGIVGYSRGKYHRPAGIRTHVLVCLGAASTVLMSQFCIEVLGVPGDTMRVPAQVISGIGFLGAGSIMKNRNHVTGLTTAAGLWATAGMGLCAGAGYIECALAMCCIIYIALVPLYKLDAMHVKTAHALTVYIELSPDLRLSTLMKRLNELGIQLISIDPFGSSGDDFCGYRLEVEMVNRELDTDKVISDMNALDEVQFVQPMSERRS